MGDNITPRNRRSTDRRHLSSTEEIKANGQTIVGLIHEDIGHLGIFVSGKVAKKEHAQIVEVLNTSSSCRRAVRHAYRGAARPMAITHE
jgi:hypothetical protein